MRNFHHEHSPTATKDPDATEARFGVSPHLIDLKREEDAPPEERAPRGGRIQRHLDERFHAAEFKERRVSMHARGWKDFPPHEARSLGEAVTITAGRFLREQPWRHAAMGLAFVALLFVVPLAVAESFGALRIGKHDLVAQGVEAATLLRAAGSAAVARDFVGARNDFAAAGHRFADLRSSLGPIVPALAVSELLAPGTSLSAGSELLAAGAEAATGGERLMTGVASLQTAGDPADKLRMLAASFADAAPHLDRAAAELARVSADAVPAAYRDAVQTAKTELPTLAAAVRKTVAVADLLEPAMGATGTKRYLVVFQNNAELRPTGGFIGSFALVDVDRGNVKHVEIPGGGSYDLKGNFALHLNAPQPLHLINPRWQFQDANWYPDFPTSASQLARFYEKSGGPTVDGVIAINESLMEKLLGVVGPIDMPEYGKTITADNFYLQTQTQVELDYDKTANKPKQFIADLAPKALDRILHADGAAALQLAAALDRALAEKDLQFWFTDDASEAKAASLGWDGAMRQTDGDYLAIVHTNIAGQKTDLVMHEDVRDDVKILLDGSGIVTLTVSRAHDGKKGDLFTGVRNVDYMRVYAPEGSTLVRADGFAAPDPKLFKLSDPSDRDDASLAAQEGASTTDAGSGTDVSIENGKTVFGNWIQTDPGRTSVVTLVYRLPAGTIKLRIPPEKGLDAIVARLRGDGRPRLQYSLVVQKQAGLNPPTFASTVELPQGYAAVWRSSAIPQTLDRDAFFGMIAER